MKADLECLQRSVSNFKLPSDFKRKARSLDQLEYFKANELKLWLLYTGPALFAESINERLAERFSLLSYAIRLLMTSSEYAKDAEKHLDRLLDMTQENHSEVVFSANVHALTHLAWQVRNYGPLWTTSGMMFESANYLLSSKFTGTVNHLSLLVERYHKSKDVRRATLENDRLAKFCSKMNGTRMFKRKSIPPTEIPEAARSYGTAFYKNQQFSNFQIEGFGNTKDCYVCVLVDRQMICGKVRFFFSNGSKNYVSIQVYKLKKLFKSPIGSQNALYSYMIVEEPESEDFLSVSGDFVTEKLIRFDISAMIYFVPLLNIFEHD